MRYFGKFRGKVLSTEDPTMSGKLLCEVAALPGMLLNWATPCVPYASFGQGFFALPMEGSDVWVEFESGDPSRPIWSGGYWEPGEEPVMPEVSPEAPELVNVLRSKFCSLVFNDTPGEGGMTLNTIDPVVEVPIAVLMNEAGFTITLGELSFNMNAETGITLTAGETVMEVTPEGVNVTTTGVKVTAEDVDVTGDVTVQGAVDVTGAVGIEGDVDVTGAVEVTGDVEITGAVEVTGDVEAAGAVEIEGAVNISGALAVEGAVNVGGELAVEGDANFLGAQQTEGNNAVLGVIEGIVVPPLL